MKYPGIVGIIDSTHVVIAAPKTEHPKIPSIYRLIEKNYNNFINVQLVIRMCHIAIFPGSSHNAYIWKIQSIPNSRRHL